MTDTPAAEIIAERTYGGIITVRALCPGCGRTHIHRKPASPGTVVTASCGARYLIGAR